MTRSTVRLPASALLAAMLLVSQLPEPLGPGESRVVEIDLSAGRAWRIAVDQLGIDVSVEIVGPAGDRLAATDSPFDRQGVETLLIEPRSSGIHRLTLRAREAGALPGRFAIHVDEIADSRAAAALRALSRAGESYLEGSAEARRKALLEYLDAAGRWHELGETMEEARALYCAAVLARLTGDTVQAQALGERVLPLWQSLGERLWEAATRNELGLVAWLSGRLDEAQRSFTAALSIQRAIGDRYGEAVSLSNLCATDLPRGRLREAVACYGEAIPKLREVRAAALEAAALTSAGRALDVLGQADQALLRHGEALALVRSIGDRTGEAWALNNLALLQTAMGELQEALANYGQALEIFSSLQNRRWQARVLHNLGVVYQGLGEPERARFQYEQALPLWRETGDREGQTATLTNLGKVYAVLGDPRRALSLYDDALALARATEDRRGEGITLAQAGHAHLALSDPSAARASFDAALERLRSVEDLLYQADALRGRAAAEAALGEPKEAISSLEQALALARSARIPASEAATLCSLAEIERRLGRTNEARAHAAAAIEVLESLRTKIGNPDLRSSFASTLHQAYELQTDLLMEAHRANPAAGFDRKALETGERARARTLLEMLGEAGIDLRQGVPPNLLERRTALERRLSARAERLLREKDAAARATLFGEESTLLRELDLVDAEIRQRSPAFAALTRPQPSGTAEIRALLDPDTLLLSYSLGEERSFLFAVTSTTFESFELAPRAEIEEAARRAYDAWSAYGAADRAADLDHASELSRLILGPLSGRLSHEGRQRLAIVPDGALHSIPFGALPVPGNGELPTALLEQHEIVVLPSASALAVQRRVLGARAAAPHRLAVLADPAFDPRDAMFARLPMSRREAEAISALATPGETKVFLDFAANRDEVLSERLSAYRTVHFATHGIIDAEHPALSGLALSTVDEAGRPREGFLHLRDVYELRLGADLVVLSGCRTALGKQFRGEGMAGLARGFFYAGAARVAASLWRVEDRATAELMTRFYRTMWQQGLSPAAALRSAQLSIRQERRWRDPYFWAGFVLQGDWR